MSLFLIGTKAPIAHILINGYYLAGGWGRVIEAILRSARKSLMVSTCISLMISDCMYLFVCLLVVCVYLEKYLLKLFTHFLI